VWLRNTLRNKLKGGLAGRVILQIAPRMPPTGHVRVISATRMTEAEFWRKSALGKSLATWRSDPSVSAQIRFENTDGLPLVYNAAMASANDGDIVLFVHDDVWFDDPQWIQKLRVAVERYDVVGIAGNTRRSRGQPAWLFSKYENDSFVWDHGFLSGAMSHGRHARGHVASYGVAPAHCELLDGVFLAARKDVLVQSGVSFDERFRFHFYDMDFCRSARRVGLSLGTWSIALTHQSRGNFGGEAWHHGLNAYLAKWRR